MLDKIKSALDTLPAVKDWVVTKNTTNSTQLYSCFGRREAIRSVSQEIYDIRLFTEITENGDDPPLQGRSHLVMMPGERNIPGRLERAVEQARYQLNPAYEIPGKGLTYPDFNDADPRIAGDPWAVINDLDHRLKTSAAKEKKVEISGSEFFLRHTNLQLVNSRGIDVESSDTDLLWDIVLLHNGNGNETEFWHIYNQPGTMYFNLEEDLSRFARYARDAARTEEPSGGVCPVVLTGDALHILVMYLANHSAAMTKYQGSALFKPGEPILRETPRGDTVTLYSNALHPGGTHSYRFDFDGLPGRRVKIIDDGVLTQYWGTKQYADYLGIEPTGLFANFELAPGNTSWDDLLKSDDRVILVVQFSSFDPQPVAGNYLGEIRVGYEFRKDGSVVPIRGGSVSGNLPESLLDCRFCKELETFKGYYGPKGVRFESARIAGK